MREYKLKELKKLLYSERAENIMSMPREELRSIQHRMECTGLSYGMHGVTGALFEDTLTGEQYVLIGRFSLLYRLI